MSNVNQGQLQGLMGFPLLAGRFLLAMGSLHAQVLLRRNLGPDHVSMTRVLVCYFFFSLVFSGGWMKKDYFLSPVDLYLTTFLIVGVVRHRIGEALAWRGVLHSRDTGDPLLLPWFQRFLPIIAWNSVRVKLAVEPLLLYYGGQVLGHRLDYWLGVLLSFAGVTLFIQEYLGFVYAKQRIRAALDSRIEGTVLNAIVEERRQHGYQPPHPIADDPTIPYPTALRAPASSHDSVPQELPAPLRELPGMDPPSPAPAETPPRFEAACPHCQKRFWAKGTPQQAAGRRCHCPACRQSFQFPSSTVAANGR